jgi:threonine synthase
MKYISTRGKAPKLSFEDVLLQGLAEDGGLYVPEVYPTLCPAFLRKASTLSYSDVAFEVIKPFIGGEIPDKDLKDIIVKAYSTFHHKAVTPLKQLSGGCWLLELYHGPTLAFKDVALQLLSLLFDYVLAKSNKRITVVGATSGDTGSAAIDAFRGRDTADVFILFPKDRPSDIQRRQMTTIQDKNVHAIAVEGTFDDCQSIVKQLFQDQDLREKRNLAAVNSINWARVMAQTVYYVCAAIALGAPSRSVAFSVPTGNFGDILAGYIAKRMGLPISQLIIGTNANDILARTWQTGQYSIERVEETLSPSMDIQISSNFERLLFDLYDRNPDKIQSFMNDLKENKSFMIDLEHLEKAKGLFSAMKVSNDDTLETIQKVYKETGEILDPHTAIGYKAGQTLLRSKETPLVTLGCAHPAKFPEIVEKALGTTVPLPNWLSDLPQKTERMPVLPFDYSVIREYILKH